MQCSGRQVFLVLRWSTVTVGYQQRPCTRAFSNDRAPFAKVDPGIAVVTVSRVYSGVRRRRFSSETHDAPGKQSLLNTDKKISTVAYNEPIPAAVEGQEVSPIPSPSWEFLLPLLKAQSDDDPDLVQTLTAINRKLLDTTWERDIIKNDQKIMSHIKRLSSHKEQAIRFQAKHLLSCCGVVSPCKGNGVRLLAIDGGGTRGIIAISVLKRLEALTGLRAHEMFDYCIGTSTGALLISMAIARQKPLDDVLDTYIKLSEEVFGGRSVLAYGRFVWKQHRYASSAWEKVLRDECNGWRMASVGSWDTAPQIAFVSTVVNHEVVHPYVFRSYGTPDDSPLHRGCFSHYVWEGLRATTAAPGYFRDVHLGSDIHVDGALLYNNPTALGIHEVKRLWPKEKMQCVVSIGTGQLPWRYQSIATSTSQGIRDNVAAVVASCTETETTHHTLNDLLPKETYYRFNPLIKEITPLDEINTDVLKKLQKQTYRFLSDNKERLDMCAAQLTEDRSHINNFWDKHKF